MFRFSVFSALLFTTACSVLPDRGSVDDVSGAVSSPIVVSAPSPVSLDVSPSSLPTFDLTWSDAQPVDPAPPSPVLSGGEPAPEYAAVVSSEVELREVFELPDAPLSEVMRAVFVDFAGYGLVYDSAVAGTVSFSGGPFTPDEATDALSLVIKGLGFSVQKVGSVVAVTAQEREEQSALPSTGVYRLSSSSPSSVASALSSMYPGLASSSVGRVVVLSGPSPSVRGALAMLTELENAAAQSSLLPWRAVVVSPDVAAAVSELSDVLASSDDPLSLSFRPVGTRGLVLLTGHNAKALDDAVRMVQQLDQGIAPRTSRVFAVSEGEAVHAAVLEAFASDIESKALSASLVGSQLIVSGQPSAVSASSGFISQLAPDPAFVEVRAVVAETRRGSAVDRSFTLGHIPGSPGGLASASIGASGASLSAGGFSASLSYLDQDTNTRLLATPRLSVAAGSSGELVVGSQVPVLVSQETEDGNTQQGVSYRDAGVKLTVSPVMLADGRVRLDVSQELSDATQNSLSGLDSPSFSTRSMTTQVVVSPGEVVAVAGLDYDSASLAVSGATVGASEARKLVILLSATPASPSVRRDAVQDSIARLNQLIRAEG